jgi:hypothetical protein
MDAIRVIAEKKLERGDAKPEDSLGRPVLGVRISGADFEEYLRQPGNRFSYGAFGPLCKQSRSEATDGSHN